MAEFNYKEYTRQRDIAQKRIKRLQEAGSRISLHIPTVKELRGMTAEDQLRMGAALSTYLEHGASLYRRRNPLGRPMTVEERRERKREQSRLYRRMKVARQQERADQPKKYQSYVKALQTLKVDIPPSALPAFFSYMDYRFSQAKSGFKYVIDIYAKDFEKILSKKYKPDQIMADFQKFEADQAMLADRAGNMAGMSGEAAFDLWDKFIGQM